MKIFVFSGVLCDYGCGEIIVVANTIDEARLIAIKEANEEDRSEIMNDENVEIFDLKEIKEPIHITSVYGSA